MMHVPSMNTVVTDPGVTAIAGNSASRKGLALDGAARNRTTGNATVRKRFAAGPSLARKAGTATAEAGMAATEAAVAAAKAAAAMAATASTSAMATTAATRHGADRNRRHTQRDQYRQSNSELTQHGV
jgi:hypothetical protein